MRLRESRDRAEDILDRHHAEGTALAEDADYVRSDSDFREWRNRHRRWADLTERALRSIFTTDEAAQKFQSAGMIGAVGGAGWQTDLSLEHGSLDRALNKLVSIKDQLEYIESEDAEPAQGNSERAREITASAQIFLVHGRNDDLKTRVARLLERTGKHAVTILHEQANQSRTIIEKFEDHAGRADYAVVLFSGDDVGHLAPSYVPENEALRPESLRARQNVVLELGWFAGRLGRSRVTVLYEPDVEMPSDYVGVTYTELDEGGQWQFELLRELRSAGLTFDLNKLP